MSSNYVGNPTGVQPPAIQPAPGVAPVVVLPADNDPNNVATMFLQQYKVFADYIAYLMQAGTGSVSFKGIIIDGVGGIPVTPIAGQLSVSGNSTFTGTIAVTGAATFNNGVSIPTGNLSASHALSVGTTSSFTGAATFSSTVTASGLGTFNNGLSTTYLQASESASGAGPSTPAITKGVYYKDSGPLAYASISYSVSAITLVYGYNIASVSRANAGAYDVYLQTGGISSNTMIAVASVNVGALTTGWANVNVQSSTHIRVTLANNSGNFDDACYLVVYGA